MLGSERAKTLERRELSAGAPPIGVGEAVAVRLGEMDVVGERRGGEGIVGDGTGEGAMTATCAGAGDGAPPTVPGRLLSDVSDRLNAIRASRRGEPPLRMASCECTFNAAAAGLAAAKTLSPLWPRAESVAFISATVG